MISLAEDALFVIKILMLDIQTLTTFHLALVLYSSLELEKTNSFRGVLHSKLALLVWRQRFKEVQN